MKKRFILTVLFACAVGTSAVFAGKSVESLTAATNMIWLVVTGALVFFMQAGFALVETGLTRAKNTTNILMKNLMDFCFGSIAFWMIGWGLMYGTDKLGLFGFSDFFKGPMSDPQFYRDWFFQVVFAATSATIVSGAMAERTQFKSYEPLAKVSKGTNFNEKREQTLYDGVVETTNNRRIPRDEKYIRHPWWNANTSGPEL